MREYTKKELEDIFHQVPPDYYQKGVKENILQSMWHKGKLNAVAEAINKHQKSPKNILDVGCASGWFLFEIQRKFPNSKATGIDAYDKAIRYGRKIYPKISFTKADAHKLPLKDKSFDTVICTEVLEHVVDPGLVLTEIRRVLNDKGLAVIEMDSGNLLFRTAWYWWTNLKKGVWRDAHIQHFNSKILEDTIRSSGFKVLEKKIFNFTMGVLFVAVKNK